MKELKDSYQTFLESLLTVLQAKEEDSNSSGLELPISTITEEEILKRVENCPLNRSGICL